MKKGIGSDENIETARKVYLEEGGKGIYRILERLDSEHGIKVSAQTLYTWRSKGNWQANADPVIEKFIMGGVLRLIKKYERDMENSERPDAQTAFAYSKLIKSATELLDRIPQDETDPEEHRRLIDDILEEEYGIKRS